jgi:hypothetical protein
LLILTGILALASCASAPKTPAGSGGKFASLDPGAIVYLWADIPGARPILDKSQFAGFDGKRTADILDRTSAAAAAIYPPETGKRFMVAARGRYPSFWAGMSFSFSASWKKRRSATGGRYWYSARENLSVFLNARGALVSDGDPFPRGDGPEVPPALEDMSAGAVFAGWIPDAAEPLKRFTAKLDLPIEIPADQLIFALYPAPEEGRYQAALRLETPSATEAQALAAMISMLRLFLPPPDDLEAGSPAALASALFANPPETGGAALLLKSAVLESGGIALLFNMFSIYSH